MAELTVDLAIVGAGPTGLYAAYYAGFRGLSVAVVDSLPELGGQITAMYPEKDIYDVAGFPVVKGKQLVAALVEQAATSDPTYLLGRAAVDLDAHRDGGGVDVGLDDGTLVHAKAVVITGGIGTFTPRPLPAAAQWPGDEVAFFVPSFEPYRGKDVVIVGGGDSAFDWALALQTCARSVTLVHRRDTFRAHAATVAKVQAGGTTVVVNSQVSALIPDAEGRLTAIEIQDVKQGSTRLVAAQAVVAALGFVADLGPIQRWGLKVHKRHICVDGAAATNLARVYAAGDISDYPGKVRLLATGFGEAATAVNNAAVAIDPGAHLFPGHSSAGD